MKHQYLGEETIGYNREQYGSLEVTIEETIGSIRENNREQYGSLEVTIEGTIGIIRGDNRE